MAALIRTGSQYTGSCESSRRLEIRLGPNETCTSPAIGRCGPVPAIQTVEPEEIVRP